MSQLSDCIYFSFVAATTTGFGDIIPFGYHKLMATIEVIFGLIVFALVTSKIVSIKQNVILGELYESTFNDKVNQLRSALLLFRQNMNKFIATADDGTIRKIDFNDIELHLISLVDTLKEIDMIIKKPEAYHFVKSLDTVDAELILNSVIKSVVRLSQLITAMNDHNLDWKKDNFCGYVGQILQNAKIIFVDVGSLKLLQENKRGELVDLIKTICSEVEEQIGRVC